MELKVGMWCDDFLKALQGGTKRMKPSFGWIGTRIHFVSRIADSGFPANRN